MQNIVVFGKHAAIAAIANPSRSIEKILIDQDKHFEYHKLISKELASKVELCKLKKIEKICNTSVVHQGIAVITKKLVQPKLEDELKKCMQTRSLVIVLDSITDPFNIGNIIRSSKAFGASFLVAQSRHFPDENSTITKVASGAFEYIPICLVSNISVAIKKLQTNDYFCYAMDVCAQDLISNVSFAQKTAIVLGAEGCGIRAKIKEACDQRLKISMHQTTEFDSINVSNAAAIAMHHFHIR